MTIIDFNTARRQGEANRGDLSAESIRERLNDNAQDFVAWLFSGRALIARGEARIGDTLGTPGASLRISLSGPDAGLWHDHATREGGDLIGLYRACMGYSGTADFALSLKEIARDYLGDTIEIDRPTWRPTPAQKIEAAKAKLGTKPRADMLELGAPVATYRYFDTHGNILAHVIRHEPDGTRASKTFRPWCYRGGKWMPGAPDLRPLYRLPEWTTSPSVVLVEGEGCADALHAIGIMATSAMQGARAPIEKTDWSPLAGKAVTIWPDADEPGLAYARDAAAKLASIGCRVRVVPVVGRPAAWDAGDCVAEGGDVASILASAVEVAVAPKPALFEYLDVDQILTMPNPKWLVDKLVVEQSLGFIFGAPGSLKTFIALDMALSLTTRQPEWWGRGIQRRGAVIYICSEGVASLKFRLRAWEQFRKVSIKGTHFYLVRQSINFMKAEDVGTLLATVEEIAGKIKEPIAAVFVDTVSRVLPGAEENLQKDMTLFVYACDALRNRFGATVFGLHHTNANGKFRGSTVMPGAGDFILEVRREPGAMSGSIFAQKIKDAEDGWEQHFKVEKISLDDTIGGPTSLVVEPLDSQPHREGGNGWPSRDVCKEILAAIGEQWAKGQPWCHSINSPRAAVTNIAKRWGLKRPVVTDILNTWTAKNMIEEDECNPKKRIKGYRKLTDM